MNAGWGARWVWLPGLEEEEEGRRGEAEACWRVGPGRLEVGEAGEEQREGWVEAEGERKRGKKVGACCCERGREEQRRKERADGGWSGGAPPSCEAQRCCSCPLATGRSTEASGRPRSSTATLGSFLLSLFVLSA